MTSTSLHLCKKTKIENNQNSVDVPLDILIEIVQRLPLKSVVRFLLLSKTWEKIIRSKGFIKSFLVRSLTQPSRILIALPDLDNRTISFFSCSSSSCSSSSTSASFLSRVTSLPPNYFKLRYPTYYVKGLMSIGKTIINPSTGKSITLPRVETSTRTLRKLFFGYDPINNDYKMLCMRKNNNAEAPWSDFKVFTLGDASWRPIDCTVPHSPPTSQGLCIDGAAYYIARTGSTGMTQRSLVRFDLKSEKFDIFARVSEHIRVPTLINYYGKVALVVPLSMNSIELRVYEAGKQDPLEMSVHNLPYMFKHIRGINHMGEIIFAPSISRLEANVIRCNPKACSFKELKIEVGVYHEYFVASNYFLNYVESLMLL